NFGHSTVSVAAPGNNILSTLPNGQYGLLSGTSMSTPFVSGVAALIWSREPSLTPDQVKQRIISTTEPIPALASQTVSSGRLNAYNALMNIVAPPGHPVISRVSFTKKSVAVDGLGFLSGSSVIEANGAALPNTVYDSSYSLANGSLTRLSVDMGKKAIRSTFPGGVSVNFTVFNPTTGERSPAFPRAR